MIGYVWRPDCLSGVWRSILSDVEPGALLFDVIKNLKSLTKDVTNRSSLEQLVRAATSVGANYSEASQSRSRKEFISKIGLCQQEMAEVLFWLDILASTESKEVARWTNRARAEALEIKSMLDASKRTAQRNQNR